MYLKNDTTQNSHDDHFSLLQDVASRDARAGFLSQQGASGVRVSNAVKSGVGEIRDCGSYTPATSEYGLIPMQQHASSAHTPASITFWCRSQTLGEVNHGEWIVRSEEKGEEKVINPHAKYCWPLSVGANPSNSTLNSSSIPVNIENCVNEDGTISWDCISASSEECVVIVTVTGNVFLWDLASDGWLLLDSSDVTPPRFGTVTHVVGVGSHSLVIGTNTGGVSCYSLRSKSIVQVLNAPGDGAILKLITMKKCAHIAVAAVWATGIARFWASAAGGGCVFCVLPATASDVTSPPNVHSRTSSGVADSHIHRDSHIVPTKRSGSVSGRHLATFPASSMEEGAAVNPFNNGVGVDVSFDGYSTITVLSEGGELRIWRLCGEEMERVSGEVMGGLFVEGGSAVVPPADDLRAIKPSQLISLSNIPGLEQHIDCTICAYQQHQSLFIGLPTIDTDCNSIEILDLGNVFPGKRKTIHVTGMTVCEGASLGAGHPAVIISTTLGVIVMRCFENAAPLRRISNGRLSLSTISDFHDMKLDKSNICIEWGNDNNIHLTLCGRITDYGDAYGAKIAIHEYITPLMCVGQSLSLVSPTIRQSRRSSGAGGGMVHGQQQNFSTLMRKAILTNGGKDNILITVLYPMLRCACIYMQSIKSSFEGVSRIIDTHIQQFDALDAAWAEESDISLLTGCRFVIVKPAEIEIRSKKTKRKSFFGFGTTEIEEETTSIKERPKLEFHILSQSNNNDDNDNDNDGRATVETRDISISKGKMGNTSYTVTQTWGGPLLGVLHIAASVDAHAGFIHSDRGIGRQPHEREMFQFFQWPSKEEIESSDDSAELRLKNVGPVLAAPLWVEWEDAEDASLWGCNELSNLPIVMERRVALVYYDRIFVMSCEIEGKGCDSVLLRIAPLCEVNLPGFSHASRSLIDIQFCERLLLMMTNEGVYSAALPRCGKLGPGSQGFRGSTVSSYDDDDDDSEDTIISDVITNSYTCQQHNLDGKMIIEALNQITTTTPYPKLQVNMCHAHDVLLEEGGSRLPLHLSASTSSQATQPIVWRSGGWGNGADETTVCGIEQCDAGFSVVRVFCNVTKDCGLRGVICGRIVVWGLGVEGGYWNGGGHVFDGDGEIVNHEGGDVSPYGVALFIPINQSFVNACICASVSDQNGAVLWLLHDFEVSSGGKEEEEQLVLRDSIGSGNILSQISWLGNAYPTESALSMLVLDILLK